MFECERCGSSYSASHLGVEHCPRCRLLDHVDSPLSFKAFQRLEAKRPVPAEVTPTRCQPVVRSPAG